MAPQASPAQTVQSSALSMPAPASAGPKPPAHAPVALFIFLGLCLAYTLSYVLYRIVVLRRHESKEDIPASPDRGVSQFMNGARLTLNVKSTPLTLDESPHVDAEKPLTDSSNPTDSEIPTSSPADSSSTPFIILTPPSTYQSNEELGEVQHQEYGSTEPESSTLASTPFQAQQPFSQHVPAKVGILSRDRVEAIALDPKLAPVQGPLRPLSMIPSPPRKHRMTLFGLGLKHPRSHDGDPETAP